MRRVLKVYFKLSTYDILKLSRILLSFIFVLIFCFHAVSAINLKCEYVTSSWYVVGDVKNCYGKQVDIQDRLMEIESVNDNSINADSCVKGFWIKKEVMHYLPKSIAKFFPELTAFGVMDSGLKELTKFDMQPFPELIRLAFYGNKLVYLEADVFIYNRKVKSISLTDNNLFIIGPDILEPFNQLTYAQVEIRCQNTKCESGKSCIQNLTRDLKKNCLSDSIIITLTNENRRLENELKSSKENERILLENTRHCRPILVDKPSCNG